MDQPHRLPLLTLATYQRLRRHLDRHWTKPHNCPICDSKNWHIQPGGMAQIVEESVDGTFGVGTVFVPTVQVVCRTCSFFHSFLMNTIIEGNLDV